MAYLIRCLLAGFISIFKVKTTSWLYWLFINNLLRLAFQIVVALVAAPSPAKAMAGGAQKRIALALLAVSVAALLWRVWPS
jgi:hypothetical protein